jgi:LacI family transcriptional regulator
MDKSKRVTMIDVAKVAGVSHQTVSRVINQDMRVAPETRERVLTVISQMNYRPSRVARSLAANHSRTLAVITYGLSYYGPTQMVIHIEKAARQAGYDLFFANADPTVAGELLAIAERIAEWSVDGILWIAPVQDSHYTEMLAHFNSIPLIQIDVEVGAPIPSVIIDQQAGSEQVTRYLLELGHRAIAEVRGPTRWHAAVARHHGVEKALQAYGLAAVASVEGQWTAESGYDATRQLLQRCSFSALVVANDQMALGAIACLHAHQLRVPEDVSVVGFDDIPEARYFSPALTTVQQDFSALGRSGLEALLARIEAPNAPSQQLIIPPTLVIRNSAKGL